MSSAKSIVVLPAYNAARTLERTIAELPLDFVDEIVLVDDASMDDTVTVATRVASDPSRVGSRGAVPLTVESLPKNLGYGGNQKRCYDIALARGADIVVMLHPDYQYDPTLVRYFVEYIQDGRFDVVLGSRIRSRREALAGGMPPYKYYANRLLTLIENVATGKNLSEWHTGMRAYRREVLEQIDFRTFSNDFIFDTQMLLHIAEHDFTIGDVAVPVRYFPEASSINLRRSLRYGALTLWETAKYLGRRVRRARWLEYGMAGLAGVATNLGLYYLLIFRTDLWYVAAATAAFLAGAVVSFTLQKFWTFRERSTRAIPRQLVTYLVVLCVNGCANVALLYVLVEWLAAGKLFGAIVSNGIVALWSFFLYKHRVFCSSPDRPVALDGVSERGRAR